MMDLEIADYERTAQALNEKIREKDKEVEEMKTEINRLEERTKALQGQIGKIWGPELCPFLLFMLLSSLIFEGWIIIMSLYFDQSNLEETW